jgi:hypothetical protein
VKFYAAFDKNDDGDFADPGDHVVEWIWKHNVSS